MLIASITTMSFVSGKAPDAQCRCTAPRDHHRLIKNVAWGLRTAINHISYRSFAVAVSWQCIVCFSTGTGEHGNGILHTTVTMKASVSDIDAQL
jgi:hypothetical protein